MPLKRNNTRTFHRVLYAGELQKVILFKRGDDYQEGVIRKITLFEVRRSQITKNGQPLQNEMLVHHQSDWHFCVAELLRNGVQYMNPLDKWYDPVEGHWYQQETNQAQQVKVFGNFLTIQAIRVDPPRGTPIPQG